MKKLIVVTNLLPKYQIEFFNKIVDLAPEIELIVLADISSKSPLNQYHQYHCNFKVLNNPIIQYKGLLFRKGTLKIINKISPDFLIFYGNPREIYLTVIMLYLALNRKKLIVHSMFHRVGGQLLSSNLYYKLIGSIAYRCYTYSEKGAQVLLNIGVDYDKIKIIGTAIDEQKPLNISSQINEDRLYSFKKENGLLNRKVFLQVVRLSEQKKPDMIIEVARKLESSHPEILFILIGGGELFDEINNKVKKYQLENSVKLLGPIYDESILSYYFKSAEALIVPTCIGLSAHHSFSYGLPVITDDNLKYQASEFDILKDYLNCLLYKTNDINSMKSKILEILNDKKLQSFLSENALHTIKYKYNLENKCVNYLQGLD